MNLLREFSAFTSIVDRVLAVSHDEIKLREAEYRKRGKRPVLTVLTSLRRFWGLPVPSGGPGELDRG